MWAATRTRPTGVAAWAPPVAVAAGAAVACALVTVVDPNEPGRYPVCPFLAVTGRWCPGCGSMRGVRALVAGSPLQAADFNLLMVLALPYLVYSYAAWASPLLGGPTLPVPRIRAGALYAVLAVVLAFWVLRNLPWAPFALLAP